MTIQDSLLCRTRVCLDEKEAASTRQRRSRVDFETSPATLLTPSPGPAWRQLHWGAGGGNGSKETLGWVGLDIDNPGTGDQGGEGRGGGVDESVGIQTT